MTQEGIAVLASEGKEGPDWVVVYEKAECVEISKLLWGARLTPEQAHRLARRIHWLARRVESRDAKRQAPVGV